MARKMFCDNPECTFKTFYERFDFENQKQKDKTADWKDIGYVYKIKFCQCIVFT